MQCDWMVYILDWINSFHVYAFTLVSGYIFAYKKNKGEKIINSIYLCYAYMGSAYFGNFL